MSSVRGAIVWSEVVVAVRAHRLWSDIDGDRCGCRARNAQQSDNQDRESKTCPIVHVSLLVAKKSNPGAKVVLTEGGSHPLQGKAKVERTSLRTLSRSDYGPTGVNRGTQAYQDLSAIAATVIFLRSITCRDLLLRPSLAFLMHMFGYGRAEFRSEWHAQTQAKT
jgi:hypothetical protein